MSKRCRDLMRIRNKLTDRLISAYDRDRPEASLLLSQVMELTEVTASMKCKRK